MKYAPTIPPRRFSVGRGATICITDCAHIQLEPDEQVTFLTESGMEYDVARKSWGFYGTPSLNGRLKKFGLRAALVRSPAKQYYIFLQERGKEQEFQEYLKIEDHEIVLWLDDNQTLESLYQSCQRHPKCLCDGSCFETVFSYEIPPRCEIRFEFSNSSKYHRTVVRCSQCGHFLSLHSMDMAGLYQGGYVDSNYGGDGLRRAFDRVNGLDPKLSDNVARVHKVCDYAEWHFQATGGRRSKTILDIGSGLCVFLYRMKAEGWKATALDPDSRATRHAQEVAGVKAICGDFMEIVDIGIYDVITLNKVLEHVRDPVTMLAKTRQHLTPGGFVYVELPDGEQAVLDGSEREEFTIDHHHVFSTASFCLLVAKAKYKLLHLERLKEPSGKYTLRGFLGL